MNDQLLDKWLNGKLSPSEMEALKADPVFMEYLKIDSFMKRLDVPSQESSEGLKALKTALESKKKKTIFRLQPWMKVAAAAIIIFAVSYFYNASLSENFSTQLAESVQFYLPDSSQVILNENSKLSFQESTWDQNRNLSLDGEAYFEVRKGATFEVNTEHGTVTVLGTKFNIFDRNEQFEVVCYEGSVGVRFNETYLELLPGDVAVLKEGLLISEKNHTSKPSWIKNESSFEDTSLSLVLAELKSIYSVNIITENIDVDLHYTGSFTNLDLETALETITLPMGLRYSIENKNVILFANN